MAAGSNPAGSIAAEQTVSGVATAADTTWAKSLATRARSSVRIEYEASNLAVEGSNPSELAGGLDRPPTKRGWEFHSRGGLGTLLAL